MLDSSFFLVALLIRTFMWSTSTYISSSWLIRNFLWWCILHTSVRAICQVNGSSFHMILVSQYWKVPLILVILMYGVWHPLFGKGVIYTISYLWMISPGSPRFTSWNTIVRLYPSLRLLPRWYVLIPALLFIFSCWLYWGSIFQVLYNNSYLSRLTLDRTQINPQAHMCQRSFIA